jgi:mono/diheme cytochrome c family protein
MKIQPWTVTALLLGLFATHGALADDAAQAERGHEVFQKWCAPCHGPGPGKPGTTALAALYKGAKPALLEERTDLSADFIKLYVRHGVSIMAPFRKTEVSDADLAALTAYLTRTR